ncbi:WAT1-related protein [Apostasia shenzhenica]|uniref:WAT1-related protein n=1 Tax=Apostasia shenzhenica TaxID=1088818 RepID=A0A2I0A380_9ASPA|nr:WAT1-related protein [Apostasia shenzhenica]
MDGGNGCAGRVPAVEKFSTKGRRSQAKLIGPILTFCGALLILEFIWARGRGALIGSRAHEAAAQHATGNLNLVKGTLLILVSCLSWSFFLILQSNTLKSYPAKLSVTSSVCCMGAVMNTLVALVIERGKFGPLVIGWDKRLFAPIYWVSKEIIKFKRLI